MYAYLECESTHLLLILVGIPMKKNKSIKYIQHTDYASTLQDKQKTVYIL